MDTNANTDSQLLDQSVLENIPSPQNAELEHSSSNGRETRQRNGFTQTVKPRLNKAATTEAVILQKVQDVISLSRYELEIDAYRGIFVEEKGEGFFTGCLGSLDPQIFQNEHEESSTNTSMDECVKRIDYEVSCPCVQSWIETEQERAVADEKKKKGRKKKTAPKKQEVILIDEKTEEGGGECRITDSKKFNFVKARRSKKETYICPCDFNPFCIASIGGVVDDYLHHKVDVQNPKKLNYTLCEDEQIKDETLQQIEGSVSHTNSKKTLSKVLSVSCSPYWIKESPVAINSKGDHHSEIISKVTHPLTQLSGDTISRLSRYGDVQFLDLCEDNEEKYTSKGQIGGLLSTKNNYIIQQSDVSQNEEKILSDNDVNMLDSSLNVIQEAIAPSKVYEEKEPYFQDLSENEISQETDSLTLREPILVQMHNVRDYIKRYILTDGETDEVVQDFIDSIKVYNRELLQTNFDYEENEDNIILCKPSGMKNLGATCYLNSQIQCLARNLSFVHGVSRWNQSSVFEGGNKMNQILHSMQLLLARIVHGAQSVVCTDDFSRTLGLENNEMQDPNEFARLLFDRMHESFQESARLTTTSSSKNKSLEDLLPSIFQGVCNYDTTCMVCNRASKRSERFMDLSLPMVKKASKNGDVDVQLILDNYLKAEILEGENLYHCSTCDEKCIAKRTVSFEHLPPVLNIQLARYVFDLKTLRKKKLMNRILIPRVLNIPFENILPSVSDSRNMKDYLLCAVQNHRGTSAYGGHYVAEALDWTTGTWFEHDDTEINHLARGATCSFNPGEDTTKKKGSTDAYNLFYVEASFLSQRSKDEIISSKKYNKIPTSIDIDVIQKVTAERRDTYRLRNEILLSKRLFRDRMIRRKTGIFRDMLGKCDRGASHDSSEILVWVDGNMLRKFVSCSENFDSMLSCEGPILKHKNFICCHGYGLHPRVARQGKLLSISRFRAYASLLLAERDVLLNGSSSDISNVATLTDCLITTEHNLRCDQCVQAYRLQLKKKLQKFETMVQLYNDLDPKHCDIAVDEYAERQEAELFAVSKTFVTSFRRFALKKMKGATSKIETKVVGRSGSSNLVEAGLDSLELGILNENQSVTYSDCEDTKSKEKNESIDLTVNRKITCEHGFCNVIRNKKLVRIVERPIWEKIKILFPNAISHRLNNEIIERGCDFCNDEKKKRIELPNLMLDWANNSYVISERLKKELPQDIDSGGFSKTLYLVHSADLQSWRMFIDFVRKVCPPRKGREETVANQLKNKVSKTFFVQRETFDDTAIEETSSMDIIKWRMRKLTCPNHNKTLASIDIIHRALGSDLYSGKGLLVDGVNAVPEVEYSGFISSMVELQSLVCKHIREVPLSVQCFHPQVKVVNQNNFLAKTGYDRILQKNSIRPTVNLCDTTSRDGCNREEFVFDPLICKDMTCLNNFSRYLDDIQNVEETSTDSSKKKSANKIQASAQMVDALEVLEQVVDENLIQVNVHEFDTTCELRRSIETIEKEFRGKSSVNREDRTTIRRSTRKRNGYQSGKSKFSLNVSKDANLATLRLQIYEQCINKDLETHTLSLFIFDSTKGEGLNFELKGEWNERLFREILQEIPLPIESNDPVLIILNTKSSLGPIKKRRRTSKRNAGSDEEESALFDVLVQMSNVAQSAIGCSRPGKRRREERGFLGTFLQSTVEVMQTNTSPTYSVELDGGSDNDVPHSQEQTTAAAFSCSVAEQKKDEIEINGQEIILIDD